MKIFFLLLILSLANSVYSDTLSLHFIKSPKGVNWSSPFALTISTLRNQVAINRHRVRHSIGHVTVELNCESTGEHLFRGMTSVDNNEERELLFKKKYGLGVLYHTYKGRLEKNQDIMEDLADYAGSKRLSHLELKIPPSTCQRLVDYAREYEERGYGNYYSGFLADPLKGEGAGCSAFVMSFLEVGGLLTPFMNQWQVKVNVPKRLVGGPITGGKVSIFKLLRNFRASWSDEGPHIPTRAWEPQKMHEWTQKTYEEILTGQFTPEYSPEVRRFKKTKTVMLDLTNTVTPTGPYWRLKDTVSDYSP